MSLYWIAALSLGFMSSLHCVGMCGPIAMALPLNRSSVAAMLGGVLLNNASRMAGYALLGVPAGLLGKSIAIAGFQNYLSILSGAMILLLVFGSHQRLASFGPVQRITGQWKIAASKLFGISSPYTLSAIGFLNALLPCGFVYMALAGAAATGSVTSAAFFMLLFGAGTAPALIFVAFAGMLLRPGMRSGARKLAPVLVSLLAVVLILRGLNLGIPYLSPLSEQDTVAACCHK